jgi:hypothetical protein
MAGRNAKQGSAENRQGILLVSGPAAVKLWRVAKHMRAGHCDSMQLMALSYSNPGTGSGARDNGQRVWSKWSDDDE